MALDFSSLPRLLSVPPPSPSNWSPIVFDPSPRISWTHSLFFYPNALVLGIISIVSTSGKFKMNWEALRTPKGKKLSCLFSPVFPKLWNHRALAFPSHEIYCNTAPVHTLWRKGSKIKSTLRSWTPEALHTLPSVDNPASHPTLSSARTHHVPRLSVMAQTCPALCCLPASLHTDTPLCLECYPWPTQMPPTEGNLVWAGW